MQSIDDLIKEWPTELRQEVFDFVEFLLEKRGRKQSRKRRRDWVGALEGYREQYTSLELQEKALEWRVTEPYVCWTPIYGLIVSGNKKDQAQ